MVYNGAIDDKRSTNLEDVKTAKNYVVAALDELKAGKPVSTASTAPYGCTHQVQVARSHGGVTSAAQDGAGARGWIGSRRTGQSRTPEMPSPRLPSFPSKARLARAFGFSRSACSRLKLDVGCPLCD